MLTPEHLASFEKQGYATVDSPLTAQQLMAAEMAHDRLLSPTRQGAPRYKCFNSSLSAPLYSDPDFVRTISHPFFEAVAKQILRASEVDYIEAFPLSRNPTMPHPPEWPTWREAWAKGCHCDVQLTREDWDATPRRDQLMMWLWLSDAHPERGAMRVLPGSHLAIMDHWQAVLRPNRRQYLPRVHGTRPRPEPSATQYPEGLPDSLGGGDKFCDTEPIPAVARRGQIMIHSGALLHSAWCVPTMYVHLNIVPYERQIEGILLIPYL